ncbi:MAG TPA: hypothetical protein DCY58_07915, partial [Acetobacterium sp.]|nr:hypothetical protein [Acetobacterium sp.]
ECEEILKDFFKQRRNEDE